MNRRALILAFGVFAFLPIFGRAHSPAPGSPGGTLRITGSSSMVAMIEDLGQRFQALHPGVRITVVSGSSEMGVKDALAGLADIGLASRDLALNEKALFAIPIARDGVVFAVHKSNPIDALDRAQLRAVLTGTAANWKALGGADAPIVIANRRPGHSTLEIVTHYLGIDPAAIKADQAFGHGNEVIRFIARHPNAIGYLSTGIVEEASRKGDLIKAIRLDGALPGSGSIRDGSWPMARPLNLVTRKVPDGAARAFIEYALSPAAREVILRHAFVPYVE